MWNINTNFALCGAYLQELGNSIQDVVIQYKKDERDIRHIFALIESHCGNIDSLMCDSCALDPVLINLLHKPSLQHLKIHNCMDLPTEFHAISTREGSHYIQLHSLDSSCPKSQSFVQLLLKLVDPLTIRQLQILYNHSELQKLLAEFFPHCCNLRALGFSGSYSLSNSSFLSLIQLCPNILHLDISNCENLTNDMARPFLRSMTCLHSLNISGTVLSNVFLKALATHCSDSLQAFYANDCARIQEVGITILLTSCTQLHTLACNDDCMGYNEKLDGLTTLIISAAGRYTPVWADGHCAKLKRLRLEFHDMSILDFDFTRMTVKVLPRLQTLSVCCADEEEEPNKLKELRVARSNLRVYFNTDVLTYDLMKLPL